MKALFGNHNNFGDYHNTIPYVEAAMSTQSKERRRAIVQRVREEGRQAALAGQSTMNCPYPTNSMDSFQWRQGYRNGEEEVRQQGRVMLNSDDVRYCRCTSCGENMQLVYDYTNSRYLAMCASCYTLAPLPENPLIKEL